MITAALGPAVTALPLGVLRVVVGGLLLVFGLQWLRKAILRASGLKALHDELATFAEEQEAARGAGGLGSDGLGGGRLDAYSFTVAFKGVLLEGLEVVFIVLTFGANQHNVPLAAAAAAVAVLAVALAGVMAHAPLARVPENTLKFGVGVMLTSFGIFWGAEGAGRALARGRRRAAGHRPGDAGLRAGPWSARCGGHVASTPGARRCGRDPPGAGVRGVRVGLRRRR